MPLKVSEAGNTIIPAYLTLLDKGYKVERLKSESPDQITLWLAQKDGCEFYASNLLALLGVVTMTEHRGESWQAKLDESQAFLEKYLTEKF